MCIGTGMDLVDELYDSKRVLRLIFDGHAQHAVRCPVTNLVYVRVKPGVLINESNMSRERIMTQTS